MEPERYSETVLTGRQTQILKLREKGHTQQEVANQLETTPSNISAIERAAKQNIEKAERTLQLVRVIRTPTRLHIETGTAFEDMVKAIYMKGDEGGIKIDYCTPELYSHLYTRLKTHLDNSRLRTDVEIGITPDGEVEAHTADSKIESQSV